MFLAGMMQAQPPRQPGMLEFLLPLAAVVVIFYFLLILPQQRQRKRHEQMLGGLKAGDRVVTQGGIYGTVVGIKENVVHLRIADQVRIDVTRSAIAALRDSEEEKTSS